MQEKKNKQCLYSISGLLEAQIVQTIYPFSYYSYMDFQDFGCNLNESKKNTFDIDILTPLAFESGFFYK